MLRILLPYTKISHRIYVEPFGGGASVLFAKRPSPLEIYNDIDAGLFHFFRVLQDDQKFFQFKRIIDFVPYSRREFDDCRKTWEMEPDEVRKAVKWFVVARMCFSGNFHGGGFSTSVTESKRNMSSAVSKWLSIVELLPEIHSRLSVVQIENQDFQTIIDRYDSPETLFYLDPPYLLETRKRGRFKHEISARNHEDLITLLLGIKGKAFVSGYPNGRYDRLTAHGWVARNFETTCYAAPRTKLTGLKGRGAAMQTQKRTETVWSNFEPENTGRLF